MTEIVLADSGLVVSDVERQLDAVSGASTQIVSTIKGNDFQTRQIIAAAVLNAESLQDTMLDKPFNLTNWIAQVVEVSPENEDGENDPNVRIKALRIVLIDDKGNAYSTVSEGVASSLGSIAAVMGEPGTWDKPVKVVAKRIKSRGSRYILTLRVVPESSK